MKKLLLVKEQKKIILKQFHEQNLENGALSVQITSVRIMTV
jgi:hypothetical protein